MHDKKKIASNRVSTVRIVVTKQIAVIQDCHNIKCWNIEYLL